VRKKKPFHIGNPAILSFQKTLAVNNDSNNEKLYPFPRIYDGISDLSFPLSENNFIFFLFLS